MKVAAVDMGTNSTRLLITDAQGASLERHMRITRLGQGVEVSGELHPEAVSRTLAVLQEYGALMRAHGVTRVRATATSAARDARNSVAFFDAAERALGVRPELLSGEEEAKYSFWGATSGLAPETGPFLVVDIGGGSTEFVLGTRGPEQLISVDMGCVRMTERHLRSDPPTEGEFDACFADVRRILETVRARVQVARARRMIGVAGTVTTLAALHKGLTHYDPRETHHAVLTREAVEAQYARFARTTVEERRSLLFEPKRAEVFLGGVVVLLGILRTFELPELTVSEADILDGLAASLR